MDDTNETPPADQLATEHVCVDDIGTQLINIESMQQTIKEQVQALKNNGVENSVLELKSLLPKLDNLQTSLRKTFDAHARPLIRDLHIFDLSKELLEMIFWHVAGSFKMKGEYGINAPFDTKNIRSCRLVCHRFCETSSHLLLHKLNVSITNASLHHLEEVSRHPKISRGVKSLHICVGLFDSYMAHSLREFAVEGERIMHGHLRMWKAMLEISHEPEYQFSGELPDLSSILDHGLTSGMIFTMLNLPRMIEQYSQILRSWGRYIKADSSEQDEDEYVAALRLAYEQYKQLLSEQQDLLQSNAFFQRVAAAVARIPTIADLSIDDMDLGSRAPWIKGLNPIDELVQKDLLKPHSWSSDILEQLPRSLSSVDFLYQLPLAVGRAGSSMTALHVNFTPALDMKLKLSNAEVSDVLEAAQHLRVLSIRCFPYETIDGDYSSGKSSGLSKLMRLLLEAPKLRDVALDFTGSQPDRQAQGSNGGSVGALVSLLPWTKLRSVSLRCLSIHYEEFAACLEQLEPEAYIALQTMNLLTGSWADLLDVLRTKADCLSTVLDPDGGELEESDPEWQKHFLVNDDDGSLATQYVRGIVSENPLRQSHGGSDTSDAE